VSFSVDEAARMRQRYARFAVDDDEVCKTRNEAEELITKWTNWKQHSVRVVGTGAFHFHENFSAE